MTDEPLADEATHRMVRQLLEDRKLGEYQILDFGTRGMPADIQAALDNLSERDREHVLQHELLHQEAHRQFYGSDGYKTAMSPFIMGGGPGLGKSYTYREPVKIADLEVLDPDAGLPEWQKRRNQSNRAKAALVAKLKGKRK